MNKFTGERFIPEDKMSSEMFIEHMQRYQFAAPMVSGKNVLDAACGEGYGSKILAQNAESVIGYDIDQTSIEDANKKYGNHNLKYVSGSVEKLPFENEQFDIVISFETIEHVKESVQKSFLNEIKRVLKKDGMLIMSTPNKAIYTDLVNGKNRYHIKEFYAQEYIDFIKSYFKNVNVIFQFPTVGYYITDGNEKKVDIPELKMDQSRYIISISGDGNLPEMKGCMLEYNNDMFYYMQKYAHDLEETILKMKDESEEFEKKQQLDIEELQRYTEHLLRDIKVLQEEVKLQLKNNEDLKLKLMKEKDTCEEKV